MNYKYSFDGMSTNCEPQDNEFTELDYEITIANRPFKVELENKEVELYLFIEYLNMSEYDNSQEHIITMGVVPAFKDLSEKNQEGILSQYCVEGDREKVKADNLLLIEDTYNYGYYVPLHSVTVTNENEVEHVIKSAKAVHTAVTGLIGFELDKMRNRIGNTGWDMLDEYCNDVDILQVALSRYNK